MADRGSSGAGCDASCGCPNPCPGGKDCRCASSETSSGGDHNRCSCGDHCGCNPCECKKTEVGGVGKMHCKCGEGCTCVTCAS